MMNFILRATKRDSTEIESIEINRNELEGREGMKERKGVRLCVRQE